MPGGPADCPSSWLMTRWRHALKSEEATSEIQLHVLQDRRGPCRPPGCPGQGAQHTDDAGSKSREGSANPWPSKTPPLLLDVLA